jgi:outer membrane immunogenic protein
MTAQCPNLESIMLKHLFSTATVLLSMGAVAYAADLPSRRAPPIYVPPAPSLPIFSWTGFYVGGQAGYDFGRERSMASATASGIGLASNVQRENGVIGGAHAGYNFSSQAVPYIGSAFGTGVVFGVEGDVDGSGARSTYGLGGIATTTRNNIEGSIRGRAGVAVDRLLFYATGGAAFVELQNTYANTVVGGTDSLSRSRVGYTLGGGVEYAVTDDWSVRGEYRYTDFGHYSDVLGTSTGGGVAVRHHETDNRVQFGFSYKFAWAKDPVVARY